MAHTSSVLYYVMTLRQAKPKSKHLIFDYYIFVYESTVQLFLLCS